MKVSSAPKRSVWLLVAKPVGLLLLVWLLISPRVGRTPEPPADATALASGAGNPETTPPAVSAIGDAMYASQGNAPSTAEPQVAKTTEAPADRFAQERWRMVGTQIEARGVNDARVLAAMRRVPRHRFVPPSRAAEAYQDRPLPIGFNQTISQPYVVATMSELAKLEPGSKVLEVGTGSGYQAAVIHEIAGEVFSLEIVGELAASARQTLAELGYEKAHVRHGNGYLGWPGEAPFDAILVTAAPPEVPNTLLEQLKDGGRLIVPVGRASQMLEVHTRKGDEFAIEAVFPVRFVPMLQHARTGTGVSDAER